MMAAAEHRDVLILLFFKMARPLSSVLLDEMNKKMCRKKHERWKVTMARLRASQALSTRGLEKK